MKKVIKKAILGTLSGLGIFCILYYTVKFYINQELIFEQASMLEWTIIGSLIIICLIIGILNSFKLNKLEKQNSELKQLLLKVLDKQDRNHFNQSHQVQNTQELSLDILAKLEDGGK